MKTNMTLDTQAINRMHETAAANDWRRRPLTRVAVGLLSWWACGVSQAVDFPAQPLQTGVVQPAPNVIFILDDSLSMTTVSGTTLDTGLAWCTNANCPSSPTLGSGAGAPYTKNPLSYNPDVKYEAWATANTDNTNVERLGDASYTSASNDPQFHTGTTTNLSSNTQTYYVPKSPTVNLADQRQYYRYQILASPDGRNIRSEYLAYSATNTPANTTSNTLGTSTSGTAGSTSTTWNFTVPSGVTSLTISSSGGGCTPAASRCADLYVRRNNTPSTSNYDNRGIVSGNAETITITNPAAGTYRVNLYAQTAYTTPTSNRVTVTYSYTSYSTVSAMGCATSTSGSGWRNCTDVSSGDASTGVRKVDDEKKNYANWYQYHRTRMKTAKAGGSEAFASLDENYRVGLMGLYPTGTHKQVFGGSMSDIIPVDSNGGLFIGDNRKDWFDHLHGMSGENYTPLRKALNAAGKYFTTARAYESTVGTETTYLACRQNFAILTTDGYWNNYDGTEDPDSDYDHISGDEENGLKIPNPIDPSGARDGQYLKKVPYWYNNLGDYADTTTLADIAMHYWKTDLRTDDVTGYARSAENRVPYSTANPAFWQHMVTFGVGLGVRGKLTDAELIDVMTGSGGTANKGWPAPVHEEDADENPENVDDLRHAALNGRGSFINANDSTEFANGIKNALNRISERKGSASNVLANSTSISTDSYVYQATYTAGTWRGELLAYPISSAGLGDDPWRASENMPDWDDRKIFTMDASGGSTFPSGEQSTALGTEATALGLPNAAALADYLKGDGSREMPLNSTEKTPGALRKRWMRDSEETKDLRALLGDIVDSSPFYVADIQTIFVGANDGMLHAFDASKEGQERFAYIPRGVSMKRLAEIADPDYGTHPTNNPHRFFVDGPVVVSSRARTPGKNYLVGAMGRGARGVYGLDVTNAANSTTPFDDKSVLWDNTGDSAPDNMGNVIAEPLISKLNNDVTAAVVANGPNSVSGTASLFIINLDTGLAIAELDTKTTGNGLSAPRAVDTNADGKVDYFFAGDLLGNLYRFDVSDPDPEKWVFSTVFTATDGAKAQPISSAPGVARDSANDIWVFFGTGRYMTEDDQENTDIQSYYGINVGQNGAENSELDRSDLHERSIQVVDSATGRRAFEPGATGVDAGKFGWFIDLNKPAGMGERVISAPIIYDNILVFSSIVPPNDSTLNSCDAGGTGYVNALDAFSGASLSVPFFDVVDPTITSGADELPIGSLPIGAGMPTAPIIIGNQLVVGDSSGGTPTTTEVNAPGGSSKRRVSWRELLQN